MPPDDRSSPKRSDAGDLAGDGRVSRPCACKPAMPFFGFVDNHLRHGLVLSPFKMYLRRMAVASVRCRTYPNPSMGSVAWDNFAPPCQTTARRMHLNPTTNQ